MKSRLSRARERLLGLLDERGEPRHGPVAVVDGAPTGTVVRMEVVVPAGQLACPFSIHDDAAYWMVEPPEGGPPEAGPVPDLRLDLSTGVADPVPRPSSSRCTAEEPVMTRRFPTGLSALTHRRRVSTLALLTVVVLVALLLAGRGDSARPVAARHTDGNSTDRTHRDTREPRGTVTLAFAGDLHFQLHLAALLDHPVGALGPITQTLSDADLTMVNLESAITDRGTPEAKLLETPADRFHFRTSPAALDVLDEAGVDVVTMANNHGADYGPVGVTDTLRAIRRGPVAVVGIGRDRRAAFAPYRTTVGDTDLAFLAADASFREDSSSVWEAGASNPGLAAAHSARPRDLLDAVKSASAVDDIVVVYLHWGEEGKSCPTRKQQITASALAEAGADVVVGSHAHQLLGSGWLGDTYVNYGLGNFLWYSANEPETGVLEVVCPRLA